jgi:hypothetical protein
MNGIRKNVKTSRKVGRCIYCGSKRGKLSTEHIYPFSLHTKKSKTFWVLNDAVCEKCKKKTEEIDDYISKVHLRDYRFLTQARSRSKYKNYSDKKTVRAEKEGEIIDITVDIARLGWMYLLPVYGMPELVSKGVINDVKGFQKLDRINLDVLKQVQAEYGIEAIEYSAGLKGELFMRFLAKVAYGFAVLEHGYDFVEDSPLRLIILGKITKNAKKFIGTHNDPSFSREDTVGFKNYGRNTDMLYFIEMKILKGETPIYIVIYKVNIFKLLKENLKNLIRRIIGARDTIKPEPEK